MSWHIVMNTTGDSRFEFDPSSAHEVARAEERFQNLTKSGFRAVALGRNGEPGELQTNFEATTAKVLFIPPLQGG